MGTIPGRKASFFRFMKCTANDFFLVMTISPEAIRREKEKARTLRKSQWWQRKLAKGECAYCRGKFAPEALTMDHIVPIARGGRSTRGNLAPACKACNSRKKYLLPMEWDEYLKGLTGTVPPGGVSGKAPEGEEVHERMPGV
jgi:5-methylcytosine-specific restriction enzyme A